MSSQEILVSISLGDETIRVGKLWFHLGKGRESASFEYDQKWLVHPEKFALEPALQLTQGRLHTGANINIFGSFGDSAPDRWGRMLMRRAAINKAKTQNIRLSARAASKIIEDVQLAVKEWRTVALKLGIQKRECDRMASAFLV